MGTYLDMQTRIADEVRSGVSSAQIKNAIQDAIKKYERRKWWFNQATSPGPLLSETGAILTDSDGIPLTDTSIVLTPGRDIYNAADFIGMSSWPHIDSVIVWVDSNRFTLEPRTMKWIEDNSISVNWKSSIPTDYAYYNEMLRFYPIPSQAYPIIIRGVQRFDALSADTDSNPWTNEAEELIRCCASSILFRRIVRDPDTAALWAQDEQQALASLVSENVARGGPRRIRAYL